MYINNSTTVCINGVDDENISLDILETKVVVPNTLKGAKVAIVKTGAYMVGGFIDDKPTRNIYYSEVTGNNDLKGWEKIGELPVTLTSVKVETYNNTLYVLGSLIDESDNPLKLNRIVLLSYKINSNGVLSTPDYEHAYPRPLHHFGFVKIGYNLFLLGGKVSRLDVSSKDDTASIPINIDGSLGGWVPCDRLPIRVSIPNVVLIGNYIYLLGGMRNSDYTDEIYFASIDKDGNIGKWKGLNNVKSPSDTPNCETLVYDRHIFIINDGKIFSSEVYHDGKLSPWKLMHEFKPKVEFAQSVLIGNKIHLLGSVSR